MFEGEGLETLFAADVEQFVWFHAKVFTGFDGCGISGVENL